VHLESCDLTPRVFATRSTEKLAVSLDCTFEKDLTPATLFALHGGGVTEDVVLGGDDATDLAQKFLLDAEAANVLVVDGEGNVPIRDSLSWGDVTQVLDVITSVKVATDDHDLEGDVDLIVVTKVLLDL